jgi:hypothetical protein
VAKNGSITTGARHAGSAFVPLPVRHGELLRILGPKPEEAAVAVDPLVKLDEPLTVVQSFIAGVCDAGGRLLQPVELTMVVDPATVVPDKQVPAAALLRMFDGLPELRANLPAPVGFEVLREGLAQAQRMGPLLYCRKRQCVFAARSPNTAELLRAVPADQAEGAGDLAPSDLPVELLSWDGPAEGSRASAIYGGGGGRSPLGPTASLEQLLLDQGRVVALAAERERTDPVATARLAGEHTCIKCSERERCYPKGGGYAYVVDRLVAISAVDAPLVFSPLGEWRLDDASRVIGGLAAGECLAMQTRGDNEFETWRDQQAQAFESAGPPRLLAGESDGRELIEVARLKLGLLADVLAQLDAVWRTGGRPHLCWNRETVRVAWHRLAATPATCWGFRPLLRKVGLQPNAPFEAPDERPLPYPPAFSDPSLLPPKAVDAARYFDEPRPATLFVKASQAAGDAVAVHVLLEALGVPWDLFCVGDAMHVDAEGWSAVLAPAAERDPDDGEGLPFVGRATGNISGLKKGAQVDGVQCRWYPRFGEAVDLHAVGMLLFESLLSHDERSIQSFHQQMAGELAELTRTCHGLPVGQRDEHARNWVTERCEADAPAAVWTRRNLLYRRDHRNATRLDAFPAALWQEIMTFGLRLTTSLRGFSFCADRTCAAPRSAAGLLLPLVELRGLIALLDDQIFGRAAPGAAVRAAFQE